MTTNASKSHAAEPSGLRLAMTLGVAGLLSGLALVAVYEYTMPIIEANRAAALKRAVFNVVPGAKRMQKMVRDGAQLRPARPGEKGPAVYAAFGDNGGLVGYAIEGQGAGFQDTIRLLLGFDAQRQRIVGMEILESRETPGLGDKIYKDPAFAKNFENLAVAPNVVLVKKPQGANNEVDAITGATISSKAVVKIVNQAVKQWVPHLPATRTSAAPAISARSQRNGQ